MAYECKLDRGATNKPSVMVVIDNHRAANILAQRIERLNSHWRPLFEEINAKYNDRRLVQWKNHLIRRATYLEQVQDDIARIPVPNGNLMATFDSDIDKIEHRLATAEMAIGPYAVPQHEAFDLWLAESGRVETVTAEWLERVTTAANTAVTLLTTDHLPTKVRLFEAEKKRWANESTRPGIWERIFGTRS